MNIGLAADDLLYALLAVPVGMVLVGLLFGVSSLLRRLLRLKSDGYTLLFFILGLVGLVYGGSLLLDGAGQMARGALSKKTETVQLRRQGDWSHQFNLTVGYSAPPAERANVQLRVTPQQFDALSEGQAVDLRVLPIYRSLALVRLASTSSRDLIPAAWLLYGVGAAVAFVLFRLLAKTTLGIWLVVLAVLAAAITIPVWLTYTDWQAQSDSAGRTLRATATVRDVTRVTRLDYFPCSGSCSSRGDTAFDAVLPFDIVQMEFTPPGATGPVVAVASADDGTLPRLEAGQPIEVRYAAADPRAPLLPGTHQDHVWKNAGYFVLTDVAAIVVVLIVLLLVARRKPRARPVNPQNSKPSGN